MNRENQKGFTLIELLAVVVILLAISVMAISSISAAIERNKAKQDDTKISVIESSAELYYNEHKNSLPTSDCIALEKLNLTEKEITKADGSTIFTGRVCYTDGNSFKYEE